MSGGNAGIPKRAPGDFSVRWTIVNAEPLTEYTSRPVKLILASNTAIAVIGSSSYSLNGGAFTVDAGTAHNNDILLVKDDSPDVYTTDLESPEQTDGGVTIGIVACPFTIIAKVDPATLVSQIVFQDGDGVLTQDGDILIF